MTYAVKVADGGQWVLCEPLARISIAGREFFGRHLARMPAEELADLGLERAEAVGTPPRPGLGEPPVLGDLEGVPTWTWAPGGLANLRAAKVTEIKAEARTRILAIMDKDQQDNALATGQAAIFAHGPDPATWPAELQAELAAKLAKWAQIEDIRAASDAIEADLPDDAEGLSAFDAATADGWPV